MSLCLIALLAGALLSLRASVLHLAFGLAFGLCTMGCMACAHALPAWFGVGWGLGIVALVQVGYAAGLAMVPPPRPRPASWASTAH